MGCEGMVPVTVTARKGLNMRMKVKLLLIGGASLFIIF